MNYKKIASILVLLAGLTGLAFGQQGQAALTSTTLSGAISSTATSLCLASVTGIAAPYLPGTPVSEIYIDREALGVFSVNTVSNCVGVNRGYLGTKQSAHSNGKMVLISNQYQTTLAQGGNPSPNGFDDHDPSQGASCASGTGSLVSTLPATYPLLNVLTGAQWLCSTITNTWVPGFNNPLAMVSPGPTTAVASAATITITGPFFHITGTTAINTINGAVGCDTSAYGTCAFLATFDTGASNQIGTSGNINVASAITTTAGSTYLFVWNPATAKWLVVL
jgi:hypothetical protein